MTRRSIAFPPCSIADPQTPGSPSRGFLFSAPLSIGNREPGADGQGGELIDRVAAGAPVRKLLFVEALGHARVPFAGFRRITAPGSSWPQSTRIVQRNRRPTSKVDSMMVLRARRGATGSK
jgi:hypothetical protein